MRINCLSCGHRFELDDAYDDYSGLVKCSVCRSLLQIATEGGKLKSVEMPGSSVVQGVLRRHVPSADGQAA